MAGIDHLQREWRRGSLTIFGYHGVKTDADTTEDWLLVSASVFARQMRFVRDHYDCMPLSEGVQRLLAGDLRRPAACITFDDGYRNNLTVAKPILEEFSLPATVFLATGYIGTNRSLWTTRLTYAFAADRDQDIPLDRFSMPPVRSGPLHRAETARFINSLKTLPSADRDSMIDYLDDVLGPCEIPSTFDFLDWDEVHELARGGAITIGAHTVNHELLSRVPDERLRLEIFQARDMLAERTGSTPREFAFPNGRPQDIDARSEPLLRSAGFTSAVTTVPGTNDRHANAFYLRRSLVGGYDSFDTFRLTAAGVTPLRA